MLSKKKNKKISYEDTSLKKNFFLKKELKNNRLNQNNSTFVLHIKANIKFFKDDKQKTHSRKSNAICIRHVTV